MNFKQKLVGFGAATVLSLGMVSGAMAQEANGTTSVTLADNEAPTVCTLSVNNADATFGEYTWDGNAFTPDGSGTVGIDGSLTAEREGGYLPPDDLNCQLQIAGTNLEQEGEGTNIIPVGSITVNGGPQTLTGTAADVTGTAKEGSLVDLTLASVSGAANSGELGGYEGTVTLTFVTIGP